MTQRSEVPQQFQSVATPRQAEFIRDLLDRKNLFASPSFFDTVNAMDHEEYAAYLKHLKEDLVPRMTKAKASEVIETLLALPDERNDTDRLITADKAQQYADIPAGRYAIEREGVIKFYRVNKPTEGRWAGYTFVDAQASDELYPLRHTDTKRAVLAEIAKDPTAAMQRYGQELGHCGRCGRTLTDETSRELGIGPVCRQEMEL